MDSPDKQRHDLYHNVLRLGCQHCEKIAKDRVTDVEERVAEREGKMVIRANRRKADRRK